MIDLKSLKAKYDEYLNLNYIKSQNDPEEEPYKTKYEARRLLESVLTELANESANSCELENDEFLKSPDMKHHLQTYTYFMNKLNPICLEKYTKNAKLFLMLKLFEFNLARNLIETDEVEQGEKIVAKILRELDSLKQNENEYNPLLFNLKLNCFNEMIFVWSGRACYKECLSLVLSIEEFYKIYQEYARKDIVDPSSTGNRTSMPFLPAEIISLNKVETDKSREKHFESLYTHSLFFFAQIYGKLDEKEKSAFYCQITLQRQLNEHNEALDLEVERREKTENIKQLDEKVSFNPLDWATHVGAISQYYLCEGDFATARHCLCCASAILEKLNSESVNVYNPETLKEQTASINRCWGKYAIELLKHSKIKLIYSANNPDQKSLLDDHDLPSKFRFNLPSQVYKLRECEENAISSNLALHFDQARALFLKAQVILNKCKDYFVLDGFVSDHCEITRDLSELYAGLLFFEENVERRCRMQKRRLDLLLPVCDSISEQYFLLTKRQLLFDIASIYSDMMDSKLEMYNDKKERNALTTKEANAAVLKINQLALSAIQRFEAFLDTMKVQPEKKMLPDKFDDHNVRPALLAKFYVGRLYSKLITGEPSKKLENTKMCFEYYSYMVNYCDRERNINKNQLPLELMKVEYDICKEMIVYLPAQMEKIRALIV